MSSRLAVLQQHVAWLGGLTNHQDAFSPLYHMLLGVHAAAACIRRDAELHAAAESSLQRTAEALLSCGMQPLIGNLLYLVSSLPYGYLGLSHQCNTHTPHAEVCCTFKYMRVMLRQASDIGLCKCLNLHRLLWLCMCIAGGLAPNMHGHLGVLHARAFKRYASHAGSQGEL